MNDIIIALISAGGAILANQTLTRRSLNAQEIEHVRFQQEINDRIKQLEKFQLEQETNVVAKLEGIEKIVIELNKDIQFIKERK